MKLTQKTLFQCFGKSQSQSSVTNSLPINESEIKISSDQQEFHTTPQPDFLTPIHIRQLDNSSNNVNIPSFNRRKFNDTDEVFNSNQEFYRICPTVIDNQTHLPKLQFTGISSTERQMELFEEYTHDDQSIIDWKPMFESLQDYRKKAIEQNQYEQLLWTELYRPKTSQTYLGNHTRQIRRLNEWFSHWTKKLQNEQPKKILPKKRKRLLDDNDDDDDQEFSDYSNMSYDTNYHIKPEHPQLMFIHGFGTTSLVHALAEQYNFKITEINGSQSRARAPLLKQLEQVTSHHHLSFKRCPSDTIMSQENKSQPEKELSSPLPLKKKAKNDHGSIMSYFNPPKKTQPDEQKENHQTKTNNTKKRRSKTKKEEPVLLPIENNFLSSVQVEKTSLILFDEIETLTIDDNFWSCLKKLLERARKPIILTSNCRTNPEDAIINLSKIGFYELVHLETNEPELICRYLRLILLIEMLEVPTLDDLLLIFQTCSYDLRQTLSTLQFLVQSSSENNSSSDRKNAEISKVEWQSSQIFDAMYYSHLNEYSNDSHLQIFFDDLTKKYTTEYQQSHSLLLDQSKNNTKRIELYDTFKLFMQEQEFDKIIDHSSFYLDYRPYIRQICQNEQIRAKESNTNRRLRHNLTFRGCSLQWSDFEILSAGID